jgi:hypothetical protein
VPTDTDTSKAKREERGGSPRLSGSSTADASDPALCLAIKGAGRVPTRPAPSNKKGGSASAGIAVELSKAQIDQVVREAGQGGTMSVLLSAIGGPDWALAYDAERLLPAQFESPRFSRSLLWGLVVLSCFVAAEGELGVAEVAGMLRMENSTVHRYMSTLLAAGLLEQDPSTRRYRLVGA